MKENLPASADPDMTLFRIHQLLPSRNWTWGDIQILLKMTWFGATATKHLYYSWSTLWVAGVLKFTFKTPIVTTTENVTRIMVKSRYLPEIQTSSLKVFIKFLECFKTCGDLPSRGTAIEVEGIISARSKKNTVSESRMEIESETCEIEDKIGWTMKSSVHNE